MSETLLQPTPEQITENNISAPPEPTAPAAPTKRKKKFCFAFIPAVFLYLFSGGLAIYYFLVMYANYISRFSPENMLSDPFALNIISSVTSYIAVPAISFFFVLFTLIRKPKILLPLTFGASLFVDRFINLVTSISLVATGNAEFDITSILTPTLFTDIVVCVICILFALDSPSLKKRLTKTKYIWAAAISVLHLSGIAVSFSGSIFTSLYNAISHGFGENLVYTILVSLLNNIHIVLEAVIIFLLILWLANPYKKPRAPRPVRQPVQPAPVFVPVQPAPTLADELGKYKSLLDSGAISQEEFEKLKANIIK